MLSISETIKNREPRKSKVNSERAELIGKFVDELNKDRAGRLPISPKMIGVKLAHLKLPDLYFLWSICKDAPNFGKKFWWAIK